MLTLALVTYGCVSVQLRPVITSATPSAGSTTEARRITPGKGFGITTADDGKTIFIDADTDVIRLVLDDGEWQVRADDSYLRLKQSGPLQGQGFVARFWLFSLLRTGETSIEATETLKCAAPPTCIPLRRFSAKLVIN
jgi:hypothetical protein